MLADYIQIPIAAGLCWILFRHRRYRLHAPGDKAGLLAVGGRSD